MNDLDMSWIEEYSRIHSIQQIMNREELDSIEIQTIYMNTNLEITKINKETVKLDTNIHRCISKEQLLQIIQTKKVIDKTKYKIFDMLLFTVDLDPKDIQKYVNGECSQKSRLKSIPMVDDLIIPPSLFIFHSLHTFFLLFTEIAEEIPIKSILKTGQNDGKKPKHTKKVRITENNNVIMPITNHKKTRKIWYDKTTIPEK
jgi:hypothetical protein